MPRSGGQRQRKRWRPDPSTEPTNAPLTTPKPTQISTPADTPAKGNAMAPILLEDRRTLTKKMRKLETIIEGKGRGEVRKERENLTLELSTVEEQREELGKQVGQLEEGKEELQKVIRELKGELSREKNLPKEYFLEEFEEIKSGKKFWRQRGVELALVQPQKKGKETGELEEAMEKKQKKKKKGAKNKKVLEDTPPAKTEEDTVMLDPKPEKG
ncbi:hypothetical protein BGX38DRAFT_1331891 [Terfezia claveryi]|nr:hypothetical protein BGX38DRAFT_1331891 [Terfezia claveryi]